MSGDEVTVSMPVLLGATREGRRSVHVARFVLDAIRVRDGVKSELIDLTEFELPILRQRPHETDQPPPGYETFRALIGRADGLIIVTPEYKGGIPGVLKNALDLLDPGIFRRKPIGIVTVSAGGFGGINCLAQLRLVCLAMGGIPIPNTFAVSEVDRVFSSQGTANDPRLATRLAPFLDDLTWYVRATTRQRHLELSPVPAS
jgi:NAD(P)H-dependent FMN reductase